MAEFSITLKVRSYECDLYGHVNNAVYLNYLEAARVEFLEKMGFTLDSLKKRGIFLPLVNISIQFKKPLYTGQLITVTVSWVERGRHSAVFEQEIILPTGEIAAAARVTWVAIDKENKPLPIPQELINAYQETFQQSVPSLSTSSK